MAHRILIDDDTYVTLKTLAKDNGRTMVGQLRFLLRGHSSSPQVVVGQAPQPAKSGSKLKLEQAVERLKYFEEGTEEYNEALDRIAELQQEA